MTYADSDVVKELSGVSANDLPNVQNDSALDSLITKLNDRAKSLIDEYCQRDFDEHTGATTTLDGNGKSEISLPRHANGDGLYYPIIEITDLKQNDSSLSADKYRIKQTPNSRGDRNPGIIEKRYGLWPEGWENIEVTLTWGYASPPEEIKSIAEQLIIDQLNNAVQDSKADGAQSISMDGFSVSFDTSMRLKDDNKDRLDNFKRVLV